MSKFARLISRIIMCIPDEIQGNICVAKIRSAARKEATKLAKEARLAMNQEMLAIKQEELAERKETAKEAKEAKLAMKQEELATKEAIAVARRNSDLEY